MKPVVCPSPFRVPFPLPYARTRGPRIGKARGIGWIVGCALCLILASAALHGCKMLKPAGLGPLEGDAAIAAQIGALIAQDRELSPDQIRVFVLEGNVTLSGVVPNGKAKLRLLAAAKGIKGVRSVGDDLKVNPPARNTGALLREKGDERGDDRAIDRTKGD